MQTLNNLKKIERGKRFSLFYPVISDEEKSFMKSTPGQMLQRL